MKKSELKEMIKMALSEGDNYYEDSMDEAEATEVFTDAELDMASEMLMRMFDKLGLENNVEKSDALVKYINAWFETTNFVNEAEATEVFTDAELDMASEMLMRMFDKLGLENNVEKSDALVKYINGWFETTDFVNEAKEEVDVEDNEEVDVDIEKDVEVDDESVESDIEVDASMPGENTDEVAVQSLLMKAQEKATKLGDEKLTDQIGNTITYFTRAHISTVDESEDYNSDVADISIDNPAEDAVVGLDESISRFQKLAGIIK